MLKRCKAVRRHLHEIGTASGRQVATLLQNTQALLMPSFAEGFGIPVQEALSLGVPVIFPPSPRSSNTPVTSPITSSPTTEKHGWKLCWTMPQRIRAGGRCSLSA